MAKLDIYLSICIYDLVYIYEYFNEQVMVCISEFLFSSSLIWKISETIYTQPISKSMSHLS